MIEKAAYPFGKHPKLNELMALVAISAASASGNGYDLTVIEREANRAAKLWEEHQAAIEAMPLNVLREALEPFATCWTDDEIDGAPDEMPVEEALYGPSQPTVGDLRRARAALERVSLSGQPSGATKRMAKIMGCRLVRSKYASSLTQSDAREDEGTNGDHP